MALIVFIIPLIFYLFTLAPSIVGAGDSAELTVTAFQMGIAHPPGYPLFNFIGNIFLRIMPYSTTAFRMNLMSAFFSSLTLVLIYLTIKKLTKDKLAGLLPVFLLGFSSIYWKYSVICEVFALSSFFAALLSYTSVLAIEKKTTFLYLLLAFFFGLALTHHQSILFLLPVIILVFLSKEANKISDLFKYLISFCFGLIPLLYLFIRAYAKPEINWFNPSTLDSFEKTIFRTLYGSPGLNLEQLYTFTGSPFYNYLLSLLLQFSVIGLVLAILGLIFLKNNKKIFLFFSFLLTGPIFMLFLKFDKNPLYFHIISRFYLLSFVFVTIIAGCGLSLLKKRIPSFAYTFIPILALIPLILNYQNCDYSKSTFLDNFCKSALISSGEKKSIVIVTGDATIMGFDYLQMVEKVKRETRVFSLEKLSHKWYVYEAKDNYKDVNFPFERIQINENLDAFLDANSGDFNYFVLGITQDKIGPNYKPIGFCIGSRLFKNGILPIGYANEINTIEEKLNEYKLKRYNNDSDFELELNNFASKSYVATGNQFFIIKDFYNAERLYKKALEIDNSNYGAYQNLGAIYYTVLC